MHALGLGPNDLGPFLLPVDADASRQQRVANQIASVPPIGSCILIFHVLILVLLPDILVVVIFIVFVPQLAFTQSARVMLADAFGRAIEVGALCSSSRSSSSSSSSSSRSSSSSSDGGSGNACIVCVRALSSVVSSALRLATWRAVATPAESLPLSASTMRTALVRLGSASVTSLSTCRGSTRSVGRLATSSRTITTLSPSLIALLPVSRVVVCLGASSSVAS
ncbi:hypothetical protein CAOG_010079 [Capsaspora owczarzaki ATCC 30864]|uniref:Uncharacterized protein n=1 Tax=Capsaspora owczarzaki (strain ATCC 30864) TaxID=595528 RepID=A0A0D2VZA0_CAPO3|nr:hypothetical protein CAOG_010079 [Capsaspora owczarzaki ATCC 30864]